MIIFSINSKEDIQLVADYLESALGKKKENETIAVTAETVK